MNSKVGHKETDTSKTKSLMLIHGPQGEPGEQMLFPRFSYTVPCDGSDGCSRLIIHRADRKELSPGTFTRVLRGCQGGSAATTRVIAADLLTGSSAVPLHATRHTSASDPFPGFPRVD